LAYAHRDGLLIRLAGGQIQGGRDYQEDSYRVLDLNAQAKDDLSAEAFDHALLILTDGMGGHVGGALASEIIANEFASFFEQAISQNSPISALYDALHAANDALAEAVSQSPELEGMGTTLVAAYIRDSELYWCSVGDSLLYLLRNGALQRLNADHSMVPIINKMVALGELTEAQGRDDPRRNALRAAVDGSVLDLIDLPDTSYRLQRDDVLVLASDGLETLSEPEIAATLEGGRDLAVADKLKALLSGVRSYNVPNQDNTTVILYDVHNRVGRTGDGAGPVADTKLRERRMERDVASHASNATPNRTQGSDDFQGREKRGSMWLAAIGLSVIAVAALAAIMFFMGPSSQNPLNPLESAEPLETRVDVSDENDEQDSKVPEDGLEDPDSKTYPNVEPDAELEPQDQADDTLDVEDTEETGEVTPEDE